jgi:hypothetical protein
MPTVPVEWVQPWCFQHSTRFLKFVHIMFITTALHPGLRGLMVKALVFGYEYHQRLGVRVLPRSDNSYYLLKMGLAGFVCRLF